MTVTTDLTCFHFHLTIQANSFKLCWMITALLEANQQLLLLPSVKIEVWRVTMYFFVMPLLISIYVSLETRNLLSTFPETVQHQ